MPIAFEFPDDLYFKITFQRDRDLAHLAFWRNSGENKSMNFVKIQTTKKQMKSEMQISSKSGFRLLC